MPEFSNVLLAFACSQVFSSIACKYSDPIPRPRVVPEWYLGGRLVEVWLHAEVWLGGDLVLVHEEGECVRQEKGQVNLRRGRRFSFFGKLHV